MMIRQGMLVIITTTAIVICGCDKPAPPPTIATKPPAEATQPAGPTTQELLNGPYKRVSLTPIPFWARVPESWENKIPKGTTLNFLEGPGPDGGTIQISLENGTLVPSEDILKNLLKRAQKNADANKDKFRLFQIKQMGETQVMEEQTSFTNPQDPQQQLIDWKLTFFVHRDIDYATYVVDVLGLPAGRFEQSKELIGKIFGSITYDPAAANPVSPASP
jgi:hypothetical protein